MVATNETAELALIGSAFGQQIVITHHFRHVAVGGGGTLQQLIDAWQAPCQAAFLGVSYSSYTLSRIRARHVCGTTPLDATAEEVVAAAGTRVIAGDSAPPWFAAVVRERTAFSGRSYRGRFFLPLSGEVDFLQDALSAAYITAANAYVTALGNTFLAGGTASAVWRLVVHSRKIAEQAGAQCTTSSTFVETLALQPNLTTQRSRRNRPA